MSGLWLYLRLSQLEKLRHLQKIMMTTTRNKHDIIDIERVRSCKETFKWVFVHGRERDCYQEAES